jgi:hypothetical protein
MRSLFFITNTCSNSSHFDLCAVIRFTPHFQESFEDVEYSTACANNILDTTFPGNGSDASQDSIKLNKEFISLSNFSFPRKSLSTKEYFIYFLSSVNISDIFFHLVF